MAVEGKSIRWIVVASMILVAYVGWGCLAGSYAGSSAVVVAPEAPGSVRTSRGLGIALMVSAAINFVVTSVTQLPNIADVIRWNFGNRLWLPILFLILEVAVVAGGFGLQKLEENLAAPPGRRKKKRRKK